MQKYVTYSMKSKLFLKYNIINAFITSQSSVQFSVCHLQFKSSVQPYSTNCCSGLFTFCNSVKGNKIKRIKGVGNK